MPTALPFTRMCTNQSCLQTLPNVSLSITISRSSLRLTSIETVMPSSHLILCRPLLLSGQFGVGLVPTPVRSSTICWVSCLLSSLWKCQFLSHIKFMRDLIFLFPWSLPIPAPTPNQCFDYRRWYVLISDRTLPFQMLRLLSVLILLDQLLFYLTDNFS